MSDIEENSHLSARKRGKRCKRGSPPMYNEEEKFNILIGNIRKVKGRKTIKRKNIVDSECEDEVNASAPISDQVVVDASKNSDSYAKIDAWHQEEAEMYQAYGETSSKRARLNDENGREGDGDKERKDNGDGEFVQKDINVADFSQARSPTYSPKHVETNEEPVCNVNNENLTEIMREHSKIVVSEWLKILNVHFKSNSLTSEEYHWAFNVVVQPLLGDGDWTIRDLLEWIIMKNSVDIKEQKSNTSSNEAYTPTASGPNGAAEVTTTHEVEATNAGETDAEATGAEATGAETTDVAEATGAEATGAETTDVGEATGAEATGAETTEAETTEAEATDVVEAAFGPDEEATTPVKSPEVMFLDSSDDEEEGQKVEEEEADDSSKDTEDDSDDDDPFYSAMNN